MMEKRMRKLDLAVQEMREPQLLGPEQASLTLVGWGSTFGALREATAILEHGRRQRQCPALR